MAYSIADHTGVPYRNQTWGRDDATRALCKRLGITYQAYSPLGGWALGGHRQHRRVVQQGVPVVTSSDKAEYDEEDLAVFNFNLTAAEMERLAAVRAGAH